jgi:hypothetical protein
MEVDPRIRILIVGFTNDFLRDFTDGRFFNDPKIIFK